MIYLDISGTGAAIRTEGALTTGLVGAVAHFRFDGAWSALTKTAVFRAGEVTRDVVLTDAEAVIPWEVLATPGLPLQIGVYGIGEAGTVVIPTVWARTEPILPGADPGGDPGAAAPSPDVWQQTQAAAQAATEAAEAAVAVTENPPRVSQDGIWEVFDGVTGGYVDTGISAVGPQGEQGPQGAPGYTPAKGVDYWTQADREQMVQEVVSALPVYNGEVTAV